MNEGNKEIFGVRTFETGATRSAEEGKLDYDGFLSPLALEAFAQYMHFNRVQVDGTVRASDNWQKGIPLESYRKSMWRHFKDMWTLARRWEILPCPTSVITGWVWALTALMFNVQGMLHELLVKYPDAMKWAVAKAEADRDLNDAIPF